MIRWLRSMLGGKRDVERLEHLEKRDRETREHVAHAVREATLTVEAARKAEQAVRNIHR